MVLIVVYVSWGGYFGDMCHVPIGVRDVSLTVDNKRMAGGGGRGWSRRGIGDSVCGLCHGDMRSMSWCMRGAVVLNVGPSFVLHGVEGSTSFVKSTTSHFSFRGNTVIGTMGSPFTIGTHRSGRTGRNCSEGRRS